VLTGNNPPPPHNHGVPSSPKLLGVLTATQTQRGQPKHPFSVDPTDPRRNHLTKPNTTAQFSSPTTGRSPQTAARGMNRPP
jgi:hypothetical protein